jgi:hypothetical protein
VPLEEREVGVVGGYAPLTEPEIYVQLKILKNEKTVCFVLRLAAIQVSQEENITLIYIVEGQ